LLATHTGYIASHTEVDDGQLLVRETVDVQPTQYRQTAAVVDLILDLLQTTLENWKWKEFRCNFLRLNAKFYSMSAGQPIISKRLKPTRKTGKSISYFLVLFIRDHVYKRSLVRKVFPGPGEKAMDGSRPSFGQGHWELFSCNSRERALLVSYGVKLVVKFSILDILSCRRGVQSVKEESLSDTRGVIGGH
jgi:hypothetical protein